MGFFFMFDDMFLIKSCTDAYWATRVLMVNKLNFTCVGFFQRFVRVPQRWWWCRPCSENPGSVAFPRPGGCPAGELLRSAWPARPCFKHSNSATQRGMLLSKWTAVQHRPQNTSQPRPPVLIRCLFCQRNSWGNLAICLCHLWWNRVWKQQFLLSLTGKLHIESQNYLGRKRPLRSSNPIENMLKCPAFR